MSSVALIIVDVQNDFCSGGSLAVPQAEEIIPVVNRLIESFQKKGLPVFATRDWHPADHSSFKKYGGLWPVHCVAGTNGAEFHPDLKINDRLIIIDKATKKDKDAYSAFDGTNLQNILQEKGIKQVYVCGLATDYCVKATVLDALKNGFACKVVQDGIRGVEVNPGDVEKALIEMREKGAVLIKSEQIQF